MSKLLLFPSRPWVGSPFAVPSCIKEVIACEEAEQDGEGAWIAEELRRQYTLLLLRRYFRMSIDMGRLPSLLGRNEYFRARVSSYKTHTFEDAVIFVHDMERSLEKLDETSRRIIAGLVFLEYSRGEMAEAFGVYRTTISSHYKRALNSLGRILLESRLIDPAELRRVATRHRASSGARVREFPARKPCVSEPLRPAVPMEPFLVKNRN